MAVQSVQGSTGGVPDRGSSRAPPCLFTHRLSETLSCKEVPDAPGDGFAVLLHREVAGVQQVELQVFQIALLV